MKKAKHSTPRYTVLSLLAMYLVVALVHFAYMPNINNIIARLSSTSHTTEFLHKNSGPGSNSTMCLRGNRSVLETKRKMLVPATPAFVLFFAFIFSGLLSLGLTQKPGSLISPFQLLHPKSYLSLRTLRI